LYAFITNMFLSQVEVSVPIIKGIPEPFFHSWSFWRRGRAMAIRGRGTARERTTVRRMGASRWRGRQTAVNAKDRRTTVRWRK
jgi:hypothetical protein